MSLLAVESLEVRYGRTRAVQNLSLTLDEGEVMELGPYLVVAHGTADLTKIWLRPAALAGWTGADPIEDLGSPAEGRPRSSPQRMGGRPGIAPCTDGRAGTLEASLRFDRRGLREFDRCCAAIDLMPRSADGCRVRSGLPYWRRERGCAKAAPWNAQDGC